MVRYVMKKYPKNNAKTTFEFSINTKNTRTFFLSLLKLITVTPLLSFFTSVAVAWTLYNASFRKMVMGQLKRIYQSDSEEDYTFDRFLVFSKVLIADAFLKSVVYYLKPTISYFYTRKLEKFFFTHTLELPYECFFALGPSLLSWKVNRLTASTIQSYHLFVFDVVGSVLSISSYIYHLSLDIHILLIYLGLLVLYFSLILYMSDRLKRVKKETIAIDDQRASDMKDLFNNLDLTRLTLTDEHRRLNNFFVSDALLKYCIFSKAISSLSKILFLNITIFFPLVFLQTKNNFFEFFVSSLLIMGSLNRMSECLIDLEGKRVELEDVNVTGAVALSENKKVYTEDESDVVVEARKILVENGFKLRIPIGIDQNMKLNADLKQKVIDLDCLPDYTDASIVSNELNSKLAGSKNFLDQTASSSRSLKQYCKDKEENIIEIINDPIVKLINAEIYLNNVEILKNINVIINKSDKIAILGENGSGKSTFLRFLLGIVPGTGYFEVDGKMHDKIDLNTTYLPQSNYLYRSITEELSAYYVCKEDMIMACKRFGIHSYICNLKQGYNTSVLDVPMSIRQTLSAIIALKKPSTLLLADEPQSYQDKESRLFIVKELLNSKSFESKVICMHDPELVCYFDKVFLFSHGSIYVYEK